MGIDKGEEGRPGIDRKMTNEEINSLGVRSFTGPIELIQTSRQLNQVMDQINGESVLGFDIEIRPAFRKGQSYPPALLQLACENKVFIIQLKAIGLPPALIDLFENPAVIKTGIAVGFDLVKLKEIKTFNEQGFVELADGAKKAGLKNFGLRGLAAVLLGFRIPKGAQKTNWSNPNLTESQIRYAATDAWAGRELYLYMKENNLILEPLNASKD